MVDGNGLENRQARKGLEGSNPSFSARSKNLSLKGDGFLLFAERKKEG